MSVAIVEEACCPNVLSELAICIFSGTAAEKHKKRTELVEKCGKDNDYFNWLTGPGGPLEKFKHASLKEKRAMTEACLLRTIRRVVARGMLMRRLNGIFMPQHIFEERAGRLAYPEESVETAEGAGVILEQVPGQPVPKGCWERFDQHAENMVDNTVVAASNDTTSNLMPGQMDEVANTVHVHVYSIQYDA